MLVKHFLETARRFPGKTIIKDPFRELSFSQMVTFGATVRRIVVSQTDCPRVGVMLPTTAAGMGTILGTLWAGRTFIPLNFLLAPVELARVVVDAQIDLIISTQHFREQLSQVPVRVLYLEELGLKRQYLWSKLHRTPEAPDAGANDLAAIVYTSGTSGQPKGVCLSHGNFLSNVRGVVEHLRINPHDRMLAVLPNFHVFGLTTLTFIPLLHGTGVYCIPRFSAQDVHRVIVDNRVNIVIAIPSMFAALAHSKSLAPGEFQHVTIAASGGEPLPRKVYQEVLERTGMRLIEGYGLTETSPVISADLPWKHKVGTVGPPLPGVQVQVRDPDRKPLASQSAEGELYVRGPLVMQGYYNKPDETRAVIDESGWFRTGDVVRLDADGYIRITGRAKDLIIVGGENVYPREIEEVLDQHPAVAESAVIGRKDDLRGEAVVGFVTLREGCHADGSDLRSYCRDNLAGFKVPREIYVRTDLPRGPTGQILKRELPSLLS